MATIRISNKIELNIMEIPNTLKNKILADLTLDNPKYQQAVRRGYHTSEKPKIKLYFVDYNSGTLTIPRGYISKLIGRFKETRTMFEIENQTITLLPVDFGSRIKLRNYQVPAVEKLVRMKQGGIAAPCGSGKTVIGLEAMARISQPTLWICHSYELLNQTKERACQMLSLGPDDIGEIAAGKVSMGEKLTIALVQTLSKVDLAPLLNKFGCVVVDEAHRLAAPSFFHPVGQFPARYRLWLSATPERSDGLSDMVYAAGGPIIYQITRVQVPTLTPKLKVVETSYNSFYGADEYAKLINHLVADELRNKLIVDVIAMEAPGNYSLVLSERKEHLTTLRRMIGEALPGVRTEILSGDVKKKEREAIMERVRAKKVDVLLATQLAREGLDIIHLNRLFMTCPKRAAGAVEQEAGRIVRPAEGKKTAVIYDFWDVWHPVLKAQFWPRREVYRRMGITWNSKENIKMAAH